MDDMKLEVLFLPVSDVDRAKRFYEKLGFRLDIDVAIGDFRGIQFTPPGSEASIIFGMGITSAKPGSAAARQPWKRETWDRRQPQAKKRPPTERRSRPPLRANAPSMWWVFHVVVVLAIVIVAILLRSRK